MRTPNPNSLQRQTTDGMPQTAARPSGFFPLSLLAVLILSPLALVTTAVAMVLIQKQMRWRWYWFAGAALIPIGITLAVLGPEAAIKWHFSAYEHLRPYGPLPFTFAAEAELTAAATVDLAWIFVSKQVWLAVPGGVLAAALITYGFELAAGGAEWDPNVRRRRAIEQRARYRRAEKLRAALERHHGGVPVLGAYLDGDLHGWIHRRWIRHRGIYQRYRYVVIPPEERGKAMSVIGAPGSGKTNTLQQIVYAAGKLGRKVVFADCKGTDPNLPGQLIAAYRLGNPNARIGRWPQTPMDMWRGTPEQLVSRLMAVEEFTEPFYRNVASTVLRLVLSAPGLPPVRQAPSSSTA